jgi:hypothetical protein
MTGGDIPVFDATYSATADYSALQFVAVTYVAAGTVTKSTANQPAIGILQDKPAAAGATCAVREFGHSKARMYSTGTKGDALKVADSDGRLGTGTAGTDIIIGIALETWTATDQIIEIAMVARSNQSASYRAGQMVFTVKQTGLTATKNVIAAIPLGFTGSIVGVYGIYNTAASGSSGAGTLDLVLSASGQVQSAGPATVTLTLSNSAAINTVVSQSAAPTLQNSFVPADTLIIHYTQGTTFASCTGVLEVHVITN